MSNKQAFDMARQSAWMADPKEDLCIHGGKGVLVGLESGSLDTDEDNGPLSDALRLAEDLRESFVRNIDTYGVIQSITICKLDGVAVVVDGRTRVRAARVVNTLRRSRGAPEIKVPCFMRRDSDVDLHGVAIVANSARRDDSLESKIYKLKILLKGGVSEDVAAQQMEVGVQTIRGWLAYEDNATKEVKKAASSGRLTPTAAAELARIKDPAKQNAALEKLLIAPGKKTVAAARAARGAAPAYPSRAEIKDISQQLGGLMEDDRYYEGLMDALNYVMSGSRSSDFQSAIDRSAHVDGDSHDA